jgi:hypothetical protein
LAISINNIRYLKSISYDIFVGALSESGKPDQLASAILRALTRRATLLPENLFLA